ncbi:MAG: leucine-rich repeat domain-containing protein [Thermosynechococcaceae cyanobacterium MS004]|nr:leucine-rich repeat domain-containing protein [Thermosynechococcaceae cyanobacterium MS004]
MAKLYEAEQRIQQALESGEVQLDLSDLALTTVPDAITQLTHLQTLDLTSNQLTSLPDAIVQLTHLQTLSLGFNQLTSLPDAIAQLTNLQVLDLGGNQLTSLPDAIAQLTNLQTLALSGNQLTSLPDAIAQLTNLQTLALSDNQLTRLPDAITKLTNLHNLSLSDNQLTSLPDAITHLTNLQTLFLGNSQLTRLPDEIAQLTNLQTLDLTSNQLTSLPDAISQLTNLQTLYLGFNQLMSLTDAVSQLTNLQTLDLWDNQLTSLPNGLRKLSKLEELYLHKNDGLNLPPEILGFTALEVAARRGTPTSPQTILDYYYRTQQGQKRPLNEAKLILIGYGGVGKTSLVSRLVHNTFDKDAPQTQGIQITQWPIQLNGTEDVRLNVWDFGGQEIMHATHHFFLTQRSLYILVLNGRQGHEDTDAEYWLNLIESFGEDSPVIVVLNKIKACPFDLNRSGLRQKFIHIVEFIETDCEDAHNLVQLRQAIERTTHNLKHLRDEFPASWFGIKDQLATMPQNYLSFEQYCTICADKGEADPQAQESLAAALHRLGIVLNYKNDPRLRDTHVLNPHWITQGIYTLLTSPRLAQQKGNLSLSDIAQLLPSADYPRDRHPFLIDLMQKFELCFPFPDRNDHYLIPQLLDKQQPPEAETFNPLHSLNFQYHYPILPEGLLPRFIVRTHSHSTHQFRWRTGVILEFEGALALVKADIQEKRVYISVTGAPPSQRSLLAIIRANFDHIHNSFSFKPQAMVPIPDHPEVCIPYQDLLVREEKGRHTVEVVLPNKDILDLSVTQLLNGVGRSKNREASPINPHAIHHYDLRGASIGNWAEHQNGTQQTTQIPAAPTQPKAYQAPETT